jgi:hypothetical protein
VSSASMLTIFCVLLTSSFHLLLFFGRPQRRGLQSPKIYLHSGAERYSTLGKNHATTLVLGAHAGPRYLMISTLWRTLSRRNSYSIYKEPLKKLRETF